MKPLYLLDTNILSEPLYPVPDPQVLVHLEKYASTVSTCSPVLHELEFGMQRLPLRSRKRKLIEIYIKTVIRATLPIFPYDEAAALWHAAERARLMALGQTPAFVDGQIAAIATVNHLILVTRNIKDYQGFKGLTLQAWHAI